MTSIQEINSAIMFGDFTNDQLTSVADAIKYARAQLTKQKARTFAPGDTVKFRDNKRGVSYTGTVDKIKIKFALVKLSNGYTRFNVPLNLLESA